MYTLRRKPEARGPAIAYDLTDRWHGRFAFPHLYAPVAFTCDIQQTGDWLSGHVEEPGLRRAAARRILTATLTGRLTGDRVTFLKTYDQQIEGYDAVHYDGLVGDQGLEISGAWTIPGNWSGTFIMIRTRGLPLSEQIDQTERIRS